MDALAPSESAIAVLLAISRAGFAYEPTKMLCDAAGWRMLDDEPELGYVRYDMQLAVDSKECRLLFVANAEGETAPFAFLPLFYFDEFDRERKPLDQAFHTLIEQLSAILGAAEQSGNYRYPHRKEWPYSFAGWSLPDATLMLVQDEFDIQFGMDVSLWVWPAGCRFKCR